MSRTKMEILSTYLRTQFIIMTLAAKHVHVIEASQPAQMRQNVTSSLKFPARSSSLLPRENAVQHAVSSFDEKEGAQWPHGSVVSSSRARAVQIRSLARF